jgi:hypothetical protein
MKNFALARLNEASSWRALIWILTSFGLVAFKDEQAEAIIALGMAYLVLLVLLLLTSCSVRSCNVYPAIVDQIGWVTTSFDGGQIILNCKV